MEHSVKEAVRILRAGGVILYPTDTIWGIGCDATNPEAVAKIYKIKQREDVKSMLVLIETPNRLNSYVNVVPDIAWDIVDVADKPLTIIYPGAKNLAPNLMAPDGTIGIRIVKHSFCEKMIRTFGKPIVSSSANISGKSYPKHFHEIDELILDSVDFVVPQEFEFEGTSTPSGVIKIGLSGEVKIIRE